MYFSSVSRHSKLSLIKHVAECTENMHFASSRRVIHTNSIHMGFYCGLDIAETGRSPWKPTILDRVLESEAGTRSQIGIPFKFEIRISELFELPTVVF